MATQLLTTVTKVPMPVGDDPEKLAEWWRDRLFAELTNRAIQVERLECYYRGDHPLPEPPGRLEAGVLQEAREAYKNLTRLGVTNWVKLVADAPSERLEVNGFRFGSPSATQRADTVAWRIWQENELDADSVLVHDNALQTGQSYALVWPKLVDGKWQAEVTCEHSSQMIVGYEPGSRRNRAAALKVWDDDQTGRKMTTLYLPEAVWKWQSVGAEGQVSQYVGGWEQRRVEGETWPLPNPLEAVPVVEFRANASLKPAPFGGGYSEFDSVIPIQDRINKTIFDRLVTAEFQAFRQRWVVGWTPEKDPSTGLPKAEQIFKASQAFVMAFGGSPEDIKVGEFPQADFKQFIEAVESDVNAMAAISKTPPQYLLGAMINISGDALTAAESGLTSKTKKHARGFGESWEDVLRLALKVTGDSRADDQLSQIIWAEIERRSWAEQIDGLVKLLSIGVPAEALWGMVPGSTPQDVARWKAMNAMTALRQPAAQPQAPPSDRPPDVTSNGEKPTEPVDAPA